MNKLMMMGCVALLATCVVAAETKTAETKPMDLKSVAAQPAVQELLMEEDGVAILEKPDGSKVYFARGTAAYEFSDPAVELKARKIARRQAELKVAEFIKNKVSGSDGLAALENASCVYSGDGVVQNKHASEDHLIKLQEEIKSSTQAVLSGLTVLESKKVPTPGKTSGLIQVTMVYSSVTLDAAKKMAIDMQNAQTEVEINAAKNAQRITAATQPAQAATAAVSTSAAQAGAAATAVAAPKKDASCSPVVNKPEHRVNKTVY